MRWLLFNNPRRPPTHPSSAPTPSPPKYIVNLAHNAASSQNYYLLRDAYKGSAQAARMAINASTHRAAWLENP